MNRLSKIWVFLCALLALSFLTTVHAQFFVTKVNGRVTLENGNYLKAGTRLLPEDKLIFSSAKDNVRAISPEKGTFIFSPSPNATSRNNFLIEVLSLCVRTTANSSSLSGRASVVEIIPEELKSAKKVIVGNFNKYLFDKRKYPVEGKNSFFLEITISNTRKVQRPLTTNRDTLLVPYTAFLYSNEKNDEPAIPTTYRFGFVRNGRSEKVADISPYFDVSNDMLSIINSVVGVWKDKQISTDSLRDMCYSQVYETIGKPNSISFFSTFHNILTNSDSVENKYTPHFTGYDKETDPSEFSVASERVASSRAQLPAAVSLRQFAPAIGDQGQTGTCTAWATVYAGRTISYIYNRLGANPNYSDSIAKYSFSPEYIYFKIRYGNNCNMGSTISSALQRMKKDGNVLTQKQVGFNCSKIFSLQDTTTANNYGIKDFQSLIEYDETYKVFKEATIGKMKQYLSENKPVVISAHLPASFDRIDKTGIWQPAQFEYDTVVKVKSCMATSYSSQACKYSGHAMCIIGYNDDVNGGSFEVMNSWGKEWGNEGICWISYKDFRYFGMAAYIMNDYDTVPKKQLVFKGSIEFTEKCGDSCLKDMAVEKLAGGAAQRGQRVVEEETLPSNTTLFGFRNSYVSGTKYRMKIKNEGASYIYVFTYDGRTADPIFPLVNNTKKESALIDLKQSNLFIPAIGSSIQLDNVPGIENLCFVISKDSVNCAQILDSLQKNGKTNGFYKTTSELLPSRIELNDKMTSKDNLIEYETIAGDKSYMVFFVRLKHI